MEAVGAIRLQTHTTFAPNSCITLALRSLIELIHHNARPKFKCRALVAAAGRFIFTDNLDFPVVMRPDG
jgi:hypothetical protein